MKSILILLCSLISIGLNSQQSNWEVYPLFGTIFNHSPAAKAQITEPSYGMRIAYTKRLDTGTNFFQKFNYPAVGVAVNAVQYGDNHIFGNSLGVNATIGFYVIEKEKYNLQVTAGLGAGYLTVEYENSFNHSNTAIGSNINLAPSILVSGEYFLSNSLSIKPSVGILHYSNGHVTLPNLGTNYIFSSLGLSYRSNKYDKSKFVNNQKEVRQFRNEITLCPGLSDRGTYNNNIILPTYSIHYNRLFFTSKYNAIKAGISAEYKNNDYDPAYNLLEFKDNADLALTIGDELFFGRTSIHASMGVYLYSYYQFRKFVYQRWGLTYRLPIKSDKIGFSVGAQLKVHYGAAELSEAKISMLF